MPSVYNYRHVELDKVGRGKRVIQPPGGQTADIFGSRSEPSYSSASSQAGSDVASSRVHIETDQQSIGGHSAGGQLMDGIMKHAGPNGGQQSPYGVGVVDSANSIRPAAGQTLAQQSLLMAEDSLSRPTQLSQVGGQLPQQQQQQQQQMIQQQKLTQLQQQQDVNRTPKKTIPVIRRNPITGEIYDNPSERQPVNRVRQPPGGRSSGIF